MTATDELLANAEAYAAAFDQGALPLPPARRVAVLACMDARLDPAALLGLAEGDAHVIRNAGCVATDDVVRSLAVSQRLAGTEEIIVIHHTDCARERVRDADFRRELREETGAEPPWSLAAFEDLEADVRAALARIRASPFIPHKESVRGFVYDVATRRLNEVTAAG